MHIFHHLRILGKDNLKDGQNEELNVRRANAQEKIKNKSTIK